jgi:S1-C subfamily serine protease
VQGLILTNAHVVEGVTALKAKVGDRNSEPIRLVASAPCDDLAVVKFVNAVGVQKTIPLGSSAALKQGDHLTALGYPASFQNPGSATVSSTEGSVSNASVSGTQIDASLPKYPSLIQHSAALNPGNSGGPLVNDKGELVGINTLTNTEQGGRAIQGQGYAISIDHIKELLPDLRAGKSRADVGWSLTPLSDLNLVTLFTNDPDFHSAQLGTAVAKVVQQQGIKGLFVLTTGTGSPARNAKIGYGDSIQTIEGRPVNSVGDVCDILESARPGSSIRVAGHQINSGNKIKAVLNAFTETVQIP